MKLIDLKGLMEQNPNLDAGKMQEGLATAERLRKLGFKRASYSLASPYSRAEATRERQWQVRNKANR